MSARAPRLRALVAGAVLVLAGGGLGLSASAASAATGPLAVTVAQSGATSGDNNAVLGFTTPQDCDAQATRHVTKVVAATATNPADQAGMSGWVGRNFYSPTGTNLPGPFAPYPASANIQSWANTYGLQIYPGTWTFEFRCQNNLGTTIYDTFTGTITWSSPTAWTAAVVAAPTTTTLTASPTTVTVGGAVALSAQVTAGQATPTGSVTFKDGTTTLGSSPLDGTGTANLSTSTLAVGSHSVTAVYVPTGSFVASTSEPVTVTVNAASAVPTSTTLTATPTTAAAGSPVSFTATVSATGGSTPAGTVTFSEGGTTLGTVSTTGGAATFTTSSLSAGTHTVTATFGDTTNAFGGSTSEAVTVTVTPTAASTTTTLAATPATSQVGTGVILTATVSPTAATGTVEFFDGTTSLGQAPLAGGSATLTTSTLAVGAHSVTARYLGVADTYAPSTSSAVTVTVTASTTTRDSSTTLTVAPTGEVAAGAEVTLTATVDDDQDAPVAAGTVEFFDGATKIGEGTLEAGTATFTTTDLAVGAHQLTARFVGDEVVAASVSDVADLTVVAASDGGNGGTDGSGGTGGSDGGTTVGGVLAQTGTALGAMALVGSLLVGLGAFLLFGTKGQALLRRLRA